MLAYVRFELQRMFRSSSMLVIIVGLPVALYLVYGDDKTVVGGAPFNAYYLVSMAALTIIASTMSVTGPGLATERLTGWVRQLLVTPLSGRAWAASRMIVGLVMVAPGLAALAIVAVLYGQVELTAGQWVALVGVFALGALPFILIGLLVGLALSVQTGSVAHTVLLLGLSGVSGILIPWPDLPDLVQIIGVVSPLYHLADLGWEIVGDDSVSWLHVPALAAWTLALAAVLLAVRRREPLHST